MGFGKRWTRLNSSFSAVALASVKLACSIEVEKHLMKQPLYCCRMPYSMLLQSCTSFVDGSLRINRRWNFRLRSNFASFYTFEGF